ncbi:hypothetical protein J5TS2_25700 [Brevibacillus halotolerans]|nr:hypothetical protein J5TS2_25700 [Brevibacillus halotolerans]
MIKKRNKKRVFAEPTLIYCMKSMPIKDTSWQENCMNAIIEEESKEGWKEVVGAIDSLMVSDGRRNAI